MDVFDCCLINKQLLTQKCLIKAALHDTYFVVGHFHYVLRIGAVFALLAGLTNYFALFTGMILNHRLVKIQFYLANIQNFLLIMLVTISYSLFVVNGLITNLVYQIIIIICNLFNLECLHLCENPEEYNQLNTIKSNKLPFSIPKIRSVNQYSHNFSKITQI